MAVVLEYCYTGTVSETSDISNRADASEVLELTYTLKLDMPIKPPGAAVVKLFIKAVRAENIEMAKHMHALHPVLTEDNYHLLTTREYVYWLKAFVWRYSAPGAMVYWNTISLWANDRAVRDPKVLSNQSNAADLAAGLILDALVLLRPSMQNVKLKVSEEKFMPAKVFLDSVSDRSLVGEIAGFFDVEKRFRLQFKSLLFDSTPAGKQQFIEILYGIVSLISGKSTPPLDKINLKNLVYKSSKGHDNAYGVRFAWRERDYEGIYGYRQPGTPRIVRISSVYSGARGNFSAAHYRKFLDHWKRADFGRSSSMLLAIKTRSGRTALVYAMGGLDPRCDPDIPAHEYGILFMKAFS